MKLIVKIDASKAIESSRRIEKNVNYFASKLRKCKKGLKGKIPLSYISNF